MAATALDRTLGALADPTRRRVVDLLRKKPRRAGELATALATSAPAMSRHLRVLRKTGLVEGDGHDDDARVRIYRLRHAPFRALGDWIVEVEAFWSDQLAAFKAHAEAKVAIATTAAPSTQARAAGAVSRGPRRALPDGGAARARSRPRR